MGRISMSSKWDISWQFNFAEKRETVLEKGKLLFNFIHFISGMCGRVEFFFDNHFCSVYSRMLILPSESINRQFSSLAHTLLHTHVVCGEDNLIKVDKLRSLTD